MKVLGLSPLDKDATASLVEDGRVLFAAGEERFSRRKHHAGFPERAIRAALEHTGTDPAQIDQVAYAFLPAKREADLIREAFAREREPGVVRRGVHWRARRPRGRHYVIVARYSGPTVLAHELGHFLGHPKHTGTVDNLMSYRRSGTRRPFLDVDQGRRMARAARRMFRRGELAPQNAKRRP